MSMQKVVIVLLVVGVAILVTSAAPAIARPQPDQDMAAPGSFYVESNGGVVKVSLTGYTETIVSSRGSYALEILNRQLYVKRGEGIAVYDLNGVFIRTVPIPTQAHFLTFVTVPDGRIALLDNAADKVHFISSSGDLLSTVNMKDTPDDTLQNVDGVVVNNKLIVSEDGDNHVLAIDLTTYEKTIFKDLTGFPGWLGAITYAEGTYYICGSTTIHSFSEDGNAIRVGEIPEHNITGIVVVGGMAYVTVNLPGKVYQVNLSTGTSRVLASGLDYPKDIEYQDPLRTFLPMILDNW